MIFIYIVGCFFSW